MARIYLDSNVFSNLRRGEDPKYIALENAISKYKDNLVFVFSHAHIRDKINDDTHFKYADFEYMKNLVTDNYLCYHALEKNTSFYLANPLEVFQDNDALDDVNFVMNMTGSYKELRSLIESSVEAIPIGDEIYERNELFTSGEIRDQFVQFVKASLYHKDKSKIPYYDFYSHSYAVLDMLGFSKDKLSKKNQFGNIFNDSLHSYYARYCDYLITEDSGLKAKSSILYKHYDVSTKILSVEEFIQNIELIGRANESNLIEFFNNLGDDLIKSPIIAKKEEDDFTVFVVQPFSRYLNFFDQLQILKSKDEILIFLTKKESHYLSGANYRETEMIIERMLKLFGDDCFQKKSFDFETEVKESRDSPWQGRYWEIGDTLINLHRSETLRDVCVQIGPFTRWAYTSRFRDAVNA